MINLERIGLAALGKIDPETAHRVALRGLNSGLVSLPGQITSPRLETDLAGLALPNPVGLAAGFDKNAECLAPLSRAGFGFVEVGAATPEPQPGNPRPRLFRLPEDQAVINRFGFNNDGAETIASRLEKRPQGSIIGLNLGANKDSNDRSEDFAKVLARCGPLVDFATINVSSPNTENLRDLQGAAALEALLLQVIEARDWLPNRIPLFLKIAPDLTDSELADIARIALQRGLDGIVATNTTLSRRGLTSAAKSEKGGLSGTPLFKRSTQTLAQLYELTEGRIPLIGVGGIASPQEAYAKIRAGASAVQLYTALAYKGLSLAADIVQGLETILQRDGFANVAEAVGTGRKDWL